MSSALDQVKKARKVYSLSEEIEPLRQRVAAISNEAQKTVESLAEEIELLALSLTALSEESRQKTLDLIVTHGNKLRELQKAIESLGEKQDQLVERWSRITYSLQDASKNARRAAGAWSLKFWIALILAVLLTMTAHSAVSNIWPLLLEDARMDRKYGKKMIERYMQMSKAEQAQFKKLMGWR